MVREKVNDQIRKHHSMGRPSLPPLQPPGSLDGFEMFGLSSPMIIQVSILWYNVFLIVHSYSYQIRSEYLSLFW